MTKIGLVDLHLGNIASVESFCLQFSPNVCKVSEENWQHELYDLLIIPGVGSYDAGVKSLTPNLYKCIFAHINAERKVIGICLGMQLLCKNSKEGILDGLAVFDTEVFSFSDFKEKLNIGWRYVDFVDNEYLNTIPQKYYFVHNYFVPKSSYTFILGKNGVMDFSAGLRLGNVYGLQFHPEKSHQFGKNLIQRIINEK